MHKSGLPSRAAVLMMTSLIAACAEPETRPIEVVSTGCEWVRSIPLSEPSISALREAQRDNSHIRRYPAWAQLDRELSAEDRARLDLIIAPHPSVVEDRRAIYNHNETFARLCPGR